MEGALCRYMMVHRIIHNTSTVALTASDSDIKVVPTTGPKISIALQNIVLGSSTMEVIPNKWLAAGCLSKCATIGCLSSYVHVGSLCMIYMYKHILCTSVLIDFKSQ